MAIEIKKTYIFLFFILLHFLFWRVSNGQVSTLVSGDWENTWQNIVNLKNFNTLTSWAKAVFFIQEKTGIAIYISIIFFSMINTVLFVTFIAILEAFGNKKYTTLIAILLLFSPSSLLNLLMMYKDNLSYLAFALLLLIISRVFANNPLNLSKSIFLYLASTFLIVISRLSYVPYLTLIITFSLVLSFILVLINKPYTLKNLLPLLLIFMIHLLYFYSGFDKFINFKLDYAPENSVLVKEINGVNLSHSQVNVLSEDEKKEYRELSLIQESLDVQNQSLSEILNLIDNKEKEGPNDNLSNVNLMEIKKSVFSEQVKLDKLKDKIVYSESLFGKIKLEFDSLKNKFQIFIIKFFAEIKHRKVSNLFAAPNASLNYDSTSSIMQSKTEIILSHFSSTFFAPYLTQIFDMNSSNSLKIIFFIETVINYILVISVVLFLIKQKFYKLFFTFVLFCCMYITNLYDSNFGTYLRHVFIFNKLFLGIGFLGLLYYLKPNVNIQLKKGLL